VRLLELTNACQTSARPSTAHCGYDHVMADKRVMVTGRRIADELHIASAE
jgi:hypothetical protein